MGKREEAMCKWAHAISKVVAWYPHEVIVMQASLLLHSFAQSGATADNVLFWADLIGVNRDDKQIRLLIELTQKSEMCRTIDWAGNEGDMMLHRVTQSAHDICRRLAIP
jgi:hypothetical protein